MRTAFIAAVLCLVFAGCPVPAGEMAPPQWLSGQLADMSILTQPGVHKLGDGRLLAVGEGRVPQSLREPRALRLAVMMANHDAKRRLGTFLFPEAGDGVAIEMTGQQTVSEKHFDGSPARVYVGIVVHGGNVRRVELSSDTAFQGLTRVDVHPLVKEELAAQPPLLAGGGQVFELDSGWLALGVGLADIKQPGDSASEREARKIARVNAVKNLSEAVFGAFVETEERDGSVFLILDDRESFKEWSRKQTKETVAGELSRVDDAGSWLEGDSQIAVVVALGEPRLEWVGEDMAEAPDATDLELEPDWLEAMFSRPQLWRGGAALVRVGDRPVALSIGGAKLKGDKVYDQTKAPFAAEIDAQRNLLKYFAGFSAKTVTVDGEELSSAFDGGAEAEKFVETMQKSSQEKTAGAVRKMEKVGSWKSVDGKMLYLAYALDISVL